MEREENFWPVIKNAFKWKEKRIFGQLSKMPLTGKRREFLASYQKCFSMEREENFCPVIKNAFKWKEKRIFGQLSKMLLNGKRREFLASYQKCH